MSPNLEDVEDVTARHSASKDKKGYNTDGGALITSYFHKKRGGKRRKRFKSPGRPKKSMRSQNDK